MSILSHLFSHSNETTGDYLDDMLISNATARKVQPKVTSDAIKKFFDSTLIENMSSPKTDLAEAAIDHFDCRDNINLVMRLHTASLNYLNAKYNTKSVTL